MPERTENIPDSERDQFKNRLDLIPPGGTGEADVTIDRGSGVRDVTAYARSESGSTYYAMNRDVAEGFKTENGQVPSFAALRFKKEDIAEEEAA